MDINARILMLTGAGGGGGDSTKHKRSPRKRRDSESDGTEESDLSEINNDSDDEVKNWDSDYMGDEEDRRRLAAMNDLDRENEIYRRKELLDVYRERLEVRKKLLQSDKKASSSDRRTSSRKGGRERKSLSELKREKKIKSNREGSSSPYSRDDYPSSYVEEGEMKAAPDADNEPITQEEINAIQVTRSDLAKWANMRIKLNNEWIGIEDIVKDCFVRVTVGPDASKKQNVYRIGRIIQVDDYSKTYQLEGTMVNKGLLLAHGAAKKLFRMDYMSNSVFTEAEWVRYVNQLHADKEKMISRATIQKKAQLLKQVRDHVMTSDEVDMMVKAKRMLKKEPVNAATEKVRLKFELESAQGRGDWEKISEIQLKLKELDELTHEKMEKAKRLAAANENIRNFDFKKKSDNGDIKNKVPLIPKLTSKREPSSDENGVHIVPSEPKKSISDILPDYDINFLDTLNIDSLL